MSVPILGETAQLRPTEGANAEGRRITKLIRVGGKLATLGVLHGAVTNTQAHWWHVARPGTIGHPDPLTRMTFATALCRRNIVTNGYAADFHPPDGALCPACKELL